MPSRSASLSILRKLQSRRGYLTNELFVTGILIFGTITTVGKLTVSSMRLRKETHHQQLAIDELANLLEVLTQLPPVQAKSNLESLKPSAKLTEVLPDLVLKGQMTETSQPPTIELSLDWKRAVPGKPVRMVGWLRTQGSTNIDSEISTNE